MCSFCYPFILKLKYCTCTSITRTDFFIAVIPHLELFWDHWNCLLHMFNYLHIVSASGCKFVTLITNATCKGGKQLLIFIHFFWPSCALRQPWFLLCLVWMRWILLVWWNSFNGQRFCDRTVFFSYRFGGEDGTDNLFESSAVVCCITFLGFVDLYFGTAFFRCSYWAWRHFLASHQVEPELDWEKCQECKDVIDANIQIGQVC